MISRCRPGIILVHSTIYNTHGLLDFNSFVDIIYHTCFEILINNNIHSALAILECNTLAKAYMLKDSFRSARGLMQHL